jgi:hypothetical protein
VIKQLASVERLHGTTGEDLFFSVCETMKELALDKTKGADNRRDSKYYREEDRFHEWN